MRVNLYMNAGVRVSVCVCVCMQHYVYVCLCVDVSLCVCVDVSCFFCFSYDIRPGSRGQCPRFSYVSRRSGATPTFIDF